MFNKLLIKLECDCFINLIFSSNIIGLLEHTYIQIIPLFVVIGLLSSFHLDSSTYFYCWQFWAVIDSEILHLFPSCLNVCIYILLSVNFLPINSLIVAFYFNTRQLMFFILTRISYKTHDKVHERRKKNDIKRDFEFTFILSQMAMSTVHCRDFI